MEDRIAVDPAICSGKPCIRGTRIHIAILLDALAEGLTPEQIVEHYPPLTVDDIRAAVAYAAAAPESGPDPSWEADFEAAARRPLELRLRYAFIKTRRPVLDDVPYRSFDSLEDYRCWCERHLPDWLGYARV